MNARTRPAPSGTPEIRPPQSSGPDLEVSTTRGTVPTTSVVSGAMPVSQEQVVTLPFTPGDIIGGKYKIVGLIGSGGVAYVVSAMHLELNEMVALKFLRAESLANPELVERFASEARAAVKIKSEYVARVMDVGSLPDGIPFIVMEYLQGKDLADVLQEQGKLPVRVAVEYVMQACEALASAHAAGIVHRDIKPENLFLIRHAQSVEMIKVLDFGISKVALTSGTAAAQRLFVQTMLPIGTPAYMSPEQVRAAGDVDARTDIWSLGCVLFELLTGASVFQAPTLMQLGAAILEREPLPLRQYLPDASPELEEVISRCLQKDVTKRYQNVAELASALYPFAPRRARISAERCSYLLHGSDLAASVANELSSVAPPPRVIKDEPTIIVQDNSHRAPTRAAVRLTAAKAEPMPVRRRFPVAAVVGAVALLGGALLFWQQSRNTSQPAPVVAEPAPQPAAPLARAEAASTAPPPAGTPAPRNIAAEAAPQAEAQQPAKPARPRPRSAPIAQTAARAKSPGAPIKPRSANSARAAGSGEEEPDVGY